MMLQALHVHIVVLLQFRFSNTMDTDVTKE